MLGRSAKKYMPNLDPHLEAFLCELDNCDAGFGDDHPVTVHSRSRVGDTPLHWAVIRGDLETCELLLKAGADVNAIGESDYTPLHEAIAHKRLSIFKILLQHGAKLELNNEIISTEWMLEEEPEFLIAIEQLKAVNRLQ